MYVATQLQTHAVYNAAWVVSDSYTYLLATCFLIFYVDPYFQNMFLIPILIIFPLPGNSVFVTSIVLCFTGQPTTGQSLLFATLSCATYHNGIVNYRITDYCTKLIITCIYG